MLPIRTILHPTDFSDNSAYAFRLACSLARDYGARLVLLHVAEQPVVVPVDGVAALPPPLDRQLLLRELGCWQAREPRVRVEHRVAEGEPATEIVQAAVETGSDVILMATHGRTGLGRLLLGSVAERVLRQAPCPVVTVKAPHPLAPPAKGSTAQRTGRACTAVKS
jgi:nucleotide-binding universal stress UspA family protein